MKGNIFNIQRFSTSDGPGIRTVVFFKGCPLSCAWCHNPESKSSFPEIFYNSARCISCGNCQKICQQNQHIFEENTHFFLRNNCKKCMECAVKCVAKALEICGREVSSDEVIEEILRDKEFYEQSGGGVTLSGGEPLMQIDFAVEILRNLKEAGIHTAIETSGYTDENLTEISEYVDLWLYDIKLMDEDEHIRNTGVSNKKILENLRFLDDIGEKIILRCPIIPEINLHNEHFENISKLANSLKGVDLIQFEPYHPLGIDKAQRIGKTLKYDNKEFLSSDLVLSFIDNIKDKTKANIEIV